jgi:hypothetical protein
VHFYTPTFKSFQTSEVACGAQPAWPALSITGPDCRLQCDHCRAALLQSMIPARTPEALWAAVERLVGEGARGMLLTGGSNIRNEVEYGPFLPTLRRIKDTWPALRVAVHTALVEGGGAAALAAAGVDIAMMDVIGAQETVTRVYHLRRPVADFEIALATLVATGMKVVPHIVLGLHYGQMLGEWEALEMVARHRPAALVLVVIMPFYASLKHPFATPDPVAVGRFFLETRKRLPDIPVLLGCARPPGQARAQIDTYATLAGLDGIAHPSEGTVELAARLGRRVWVTPACCSVAVGEEVVGAGSEEGSMELTLEAILARKASPPVTVATPVYFHRHST